MIDEAGAGSGGAEGASGAEGSGGGQAGGVARSRAPTRGGPPPQPREGGRGERAPARPVAEADMKIPGFDDVEPEEDEEPTRARPRRGKERPRAQEAKSDPADKAEGEEDPAEGDGDQEDEADEDPDGEGGAEAEDWTPEKIASEREALEKRERKVAQSHVALTEKRRKVAAREQAVGQLEARVQREKEAASQLFQGQYGKIQAFDQIRELAQRSDPKLIEMLGLDIEKLSRYHVEEGTPLEAERRHGETIKQLNARLDAEAKAREDAEKRYQQSREADAAVRTFVRLARESTNLPLVQRVVAANPDLLVDEAIKLQQFGQSLGKDWREEVLLKKLEGRLRRLAERAGSGHTAEQRAPVTPARAEVGPTTGRRPAERERADRGLGAEPGRKAPQASTDPRTFDESQLTALADRQLKDLWRKDRGR
jgi:hypothetical protein